MNVLIPNAYPYPIRKSRRGLSSRHVRKNAEQSDSIQISSEISQKHWKKRKRFVVNEERKKSLSYKRPVKQQSIEMEQVPIYPVLVYP